MKKILLTLLTLLFAATAAAGPGDVIVKVKDRATAPSIGVFAKKVTAIPEIEAEVWRPLNGDDLALIRELRKHPSIEWAEPDLPVFTAMVHGDSIFEVWTLRPALVYSGANTSAKSWVMYRSTSDFLKDVGRLVVYPPASYCSTSVVPVGEPKIYDVQGRRIQKELPNQVSFSRKYKHGKRVVIR